MTSHDAQASVRALTETSQTLPFDNKDSRHGSKISGRLSNGFLLTRLGQSSLQRLSFRSSLLSASYSLQSEAFCCMQALRYAVAEIYPPAISIAKPFIQVQQISIQYQTCTDATEGAPLYPTFSPIPSKYYDVSFKNSTPTGSLPQWSRNVTQRMFGSKSNLTTPVCMLQFYIPDEIGPPVYFYYRMTNFYQNHRRYVKSFDQDQLAGKFRNNASIAGSDCDPLRVDPATNKTYYPCGLIANSLFNDTFASPVMVNLAGSNANNQTYQMTNNGIAWPRDANIYGKTVYTPDQVVPPPNWRYRYPVYDNDEYKIPDLHTWQEFQVWMRTAGLPTFSKLALRNDTAAMSVGTYQVAIDDSMLNDSMNRLDLTDSI